MAAGPQCRGSNTRQPGSPLTKMLQLVLLATAAPLATHALTYKLATADDGWKCGATMDNPKQFFNLPGLTITYCPSSEADLDHSYCLVGTCQSFPGPKYRDNCRSNFTDAGWPSPAERYKCKATLDSNTTVPGQLFSTKNSQTVVAYYTDINQQVFCGNVKGTAWACSSDLYCCFPELVTGLKFKDDSGKVQPVYRCAATPPGQDQPSGILGMCMQYDIIAATNSDYSFISSADTSKPAGYTPLYFANRALNDVTFDSVPPANKFSYALTRPVPQGVGVDYSTGNCIPGYGRVGPADVGANLCTQCPFGFWSAGGKFGEATCQPCPAGLTTQTPGAIGIGFCTDPDGNTFNFPVRYARAGPGDCISAGYARINSENSRLLYSINTLDRKYDNPPGTKHTVSNCVRAAAMYASYYTHVIISDEYCWGMLYTDTFNVERANVFENPWGVRNGCNSSCIDDPSEMCSKALCRCVPPYRVYRIMPGSFGDIGRPKNLPYQMSNDKCSPYGGQMLQCAPQQFIGVPEPAAPVASKAGGIFGILSIIGKTIGVVGDTASDAGDVFDNDALKLAGFGLTAASAWGGLGMGIFGAVRASKNPEYKEDKYGKATAWLAASLNRDLSYQSDYLVCNMQALVGYAYYQAQEQLDGLTVRKFNDGIRSIMVDAYSSCHVYNCLNYTRTDPAKRNAASGLACCREIGRDLKGLCKKDAWVPDKQRMCDAGEVTGVCGSDGKCYNCESIQSAIQTNTAILDKFGTLDGILNFVPLQRAKDVNSTLAFATGALVKLALLQQGSLLGDNLMPSKMLELARQMLPELKARYQFNTDFNRVLGNLRTFSTSGGTPRFDCLCRDIKNTGIGARCNCGTKTCGWASQTDVYTCSKCKQNQLRESDLDAQPNYCDQTAGSGQVILASGCLRTQTYAALGCAGGRASCSVLINYGICSKGGTNECEIGNYWGGLGSSQPSSCAYLGSSCGNAVLNSGRSKDALNHYLTDRDTIKSCGGGINSRDGVCASDTHIDPSSVCNGFSLPFLTGGSKSLDSNWAGKTIGLFDVWEQQHREVVWGQDGKPYYQPNTDVCTRDTSNSPQIDGLDNPYYVEQYLAPLAHRIVHANTEQLIPVLGIIKLFDKIMRDGGKWADKAGFFQGAFVKWGSTRYDCSMVSRAVPVEAAGVGAASAAAESSSTSQGDEAVALDPAALPDFGCSTPQAQHWIQLAGVDPAPRLDCQAGYFLAPGGCCNPCPANHYKQLPGNAPACVRCGPGLMGSEGARGTGSTHCVPGLKKG